MHSVGGVGCTVRCTCTLRKDAEHGFILPYVGGIRYVAQGGAWRGCNVKRTGSALDVRCGLCALPPTYYSGAKSTDC